LTSYSLGQVLLLLSHATYEKLAGEHIELGSISTTSLLSKKKKKNLHLTLFEFLIFLLNTI